MVLVLHVVLFWVSGPCPTICNALLSPAMTTPQVDIKSASALLSTRTTMLAPTNLDFDYHCTAWKLLVPSVWWESDPRGLDVTVQWNANQESCLDAARRWIERAMTEATATQRHQARLALMQHGPALQQDLATAMERFVDFCRHQKLIDAAAASSSFFKARIVCGRGPTSAKCPRWHVDHVPVRWVQALVGRGCEWLDDPEAAERWFQITTSTNSADSEDHLEERSLLQDKIMVPDVSKIRRAPEGQVVLLVGSKWSQVCASSITNPSDSIILAPCVHRSPRGIQPWEGRILFTMDVDTNILPGEACCAPNSV